MIIRKIEEKDIDFVYFLEQMLYATPWNRAMFVQETINNPYAYFFVAEVENKIIGYYGFWMVMDEVMVTKMSVIQPLHKKGIGSFFMQDLLDRVLHARCSQISLEVRISNHAAIALYEKFGFYKVGVRKRYYSDLEDAYTMIKLLNEEGRNG